MKRCISGLVFVLFWSTIGFSASFYDPLYQRKFVEHDAFLAEQTAKLYQNDKQQRQAFFELLKKEVALSRQSGDSAFVYQILIDFVLGKEQPPASKKSKDLLSLRESALDFLIDQAKNDEIDISDREIIVAGLGKIAVQTDLPDFEFNEDAVSTLSGLCSHAHMILRHAALIALKPVVLIEDPKWEDLSETAAKSISDDLDSSDAEWQRILFLENLSLLAKTEKATPATRLIWDQLTEAISDIHSPTLQQKVTIELGNQIKIHSGQMFQEQVQNAKEELEAVKGLKKKTNEKLPELLNRFKTEDDPVELEAIGEALFEQAKKERHALYLIYSTLGSYPLLTDLNDYQLRFVNETLISLTHLSESPLFYYRTALVLLGELVVHQTGHRAYIPLALLGNLLTSTDHPGLVLPVIRELRQALEGEFPVWIGRRMIGLIFIAAGDSPQEKIAYQATETLVEIAENANKAALRWEAGKRLKYLSLHAQDEAVRKLAVTWKKK